MKNKNILVIGGTKGLGRAFVKKVAGENTVIAIGRDIPCDKVPEAVYMAHDVTGGIIKDLPVIDHLLFFQRYRGEPSWDNELAVGLTATKNIIDQVAPIMSDGGSIVIVSSIITKAVTSEQPLSYHVCKAGLEQMTRWYAVKLGPKIRVNSVSPCTVAKDESRPFWVDNVALRGAYKNITPMNRLGHADDIANVCEFLCSDNSRFITGQNIVVDGGRTLQNPECLVRDDIKVTR